MLPCFKLSFMKCIIFLFFKVIVLYLLLISKTIFIPDIYLQSAIIAIAYDLSASVVFSAFIRNDFLFKDGSEKKSHTSLFLNGNYGYCCISVCSNHLLKL